MDVFDFASPEWLYLLLAIPALLLIYWVLVLYARRKLRRFGDEATLGALMPDRSVARGWIKISVLCLAIAMLSLAAARPRTGSKLRSVETTGREILFLVDVSNSMLAEDSKPSRMARTRYALTQLVREMKEDRVGIIAFAGEAEVLLPITGDYKMAESKIKSLDPALIANQGTELGSAMELALLSFSSSTHGRASRLVILITDGEAHDSTAISVAEQAADEGTTICAVGIGSPEGVILEIDGRTMEDEMGKPVLTKLNEELLQQIATTTNGLYVRSDNDDFGLKRIMSRLDEVEATELTQRSFEAYDEQYQWFLGAALLLLVVEMLLLSRRNPLLRGVKLFEERNDNENIKIN